VAHDSHRRERQLQNGTTTMGLDAQLKRFYPLILAAFIAIAAYFQASGIGQVVVSAIVGTPGPAVTASPISAPPAGVLANKTGKPILARNAFDSVTGPLDGSGQGMPDDLPAPVSSAPVTDEDPACSFGRVVLISAAHDPAYSFAAIEDDKGENKLRRVGETVGTHTLQAFGWDRVWLAEGDKRCQLKLGEGSKGTRTRAGDSDRVEKPKRNAGRGLPPDMAAKITKVSDTEFSIERSVVDQILENQAELMRSARIVPEKGEDGEVAGIRLFGIRSGTLLSHLGLQNGDRLESINGFPMADPQKALEAYGRLRTADALKVQINRKGQPVTIDFNIH
jgi:general secretion pathway protein C